MREMLLLAPFYKAENRGTDWLGDMLNFLQQTGQSQDLSLDCLPPDSVHKLPAALPASCDASKTPRRGWTQSQPLCTYADLHE